MPVVILTGLWLWLKPRIKRWLFPIPQRTRKTDSNLEP